MDHEYKRLPQQNPHSPWRPQYMQPLTHNPTDAIALDLRTLIQYIHSQHIIDTANMEFLLPPRNILTFLFYGLSFTSQTALFTLLFQDVTVQLTISHPKSPTSSSHTIFLHTLRTENLLPTLLSNLHPPRLMLSCLQLMSPPYTQTLHMMTA